MTKVPQARLVLEDAELVRARLEDETDQREWRLDWALAVVLLRTIGDVLHKVDGARDANVKAAANALHRSWSDGEENAIYRDFIKHERDSIVHEYRTSMSEGPVLIVSLNRALRDSVSWEDALLDEENLFRPMESGRFAGEDGRDLIDAALIWWHVQLDVVDRLAA